MKRFFQSRFALLVAVIMLLAVVSAEAEAPADSDYEAARKAFLPFYAGMEELTEDEKLVDEYLGRIKQADAELYPDGTAYGIIGWELDFDSPLRQFCISLPKGADLHTHGHLALSFNRYINLIQDQVMICMEEGSNYGYLYTLEHTEIPEESVLFMQLHLHFHA